VIADPCAVILSLRSLLRSIEQECDPLSRRNMADRVCQMLRAAWGVDHELRREIEQVFERYALPRPTEWPSAGGIGETWLLLEAGTQSVATLLRMRQHTGGIECVGALAGATGPVSAALSALERTLVDHGHGRPFGPWYGWIVEAVLCGGRYVHGASLGLAVCVAAVSEWLGRAPDPTVAAAAAVGTDARLVPVSGLREKLLALHRAWPDVRRVVVAEGQPVPDGDLPHFVFCRRSTLWDALSDFGVQPTPEELPLTTLDQLEQRAAWYQTANEEHHSAEEWSHLSLDAASVGRLLGREHPWSARALSFAALFALHAGECDRAEALLREVPESALSSLGAVPRVWWHIVTASVAIDGVIDRDPALAVSQARKAYEAAEALPPGEEREQTLGRAAGTLGRALLRAGRAEEALTYLSEGVEIHKGWLLREQPRSLCYLATGLRLAGRLDQALEATHRGLELCDHPQVAQCRSSVATKAYLNLERGRCLCAQGKPEEALVCFSASRKVYPKRSEYPGIAISRGLAQVYRRLGNVDASEEELSECLAVTEMSTAGALIRSIAALAAGEALLDLEAGLPVRHAANELREMWARFFPEDTSRASIQRRIALMVY